MLESYEPKNISKSKMLDALLRAARAGDEVAYRQFLQHTRRWVLAAVSRRLRGDDAIEDVTQNVLVKVHLALHTYDDAKPFLAWLAAIMRNTVIDFVRDARRRPSSIPLVEEQAADPAVFDAALLLREALAEMTEEQRDALSSVHLEDTSYREAAAAAGISESALKLRVHRAYQAFRKKLGSSS